MADTDSISVPVPAASTGSRPILESFAYFGPSALLSSLRRNARRAADSANERHARAHREAAALARASAERTGAERLGPEIEWID